VIEGGRDTGAPESDNPTEPVIELEDVTLGYGGRGGWLRRKRPVTIVRGLSLIIEPGETVALVGESGSGKTTVARAISGLLRPLAGAMRFRGEPLPGRIRDRAVSLLREIQYVFQNPDASLNPRMSVGGILSRPLQVYYRADGATQRSRVAAALEDVRLDQSYANRFPGQLSGGERQRVAIARAIVADPVLLLCDEVLSALDVSVQATIIELLQRLRREHRLAMLFISHDLAVVRSLADRVGVLFRGELVEIGPTDEIFAPPFHPYTHSLLLAVPGLGIAPAAGSVRAALGGGQGGGCVYAGRCPWQIGAVCADVAPPWRNSGRGLRVRCHIPLDELTARAAIGRLTASPGTVNADDGRTAGHPPDLPSIAANGASP
jgi:peptide/nickel transport system ATP-binding protein